MKYSLMVAALALAACASTAVLSTWKKPGVGPIRFAKVAVIVPAKEPSTRHSVEDQMVAKLSRLPAVPSYSVLADLPPDKEAVATRLMESGFDGAIVLRIASVDKEAQWVQPVTTVGFGAGPWPMYDAGYGYTAIDTYVRVETDIYALPNGGLIFAAASRTANPSNLRDLVDETAEALAEEMKRQGLLAGSGSVSAF